MTRTEEIRARLEKATPGLEVDHDDTWIEPGGSDYFPPAIPIELSEALDEFFDSAPSDLAYLLARNAALERVAREARLFHFCDVLASGVCAICEALAALDAEGEKV